MTIAKKTAMNSTLIASGIILGLSLMLAAGTRKPPGPCEPYAEVSRHCSDCSQCKPARRMAGSAQFAGRNKYGT